MPVAQGSALRSEATSCWGQWTQHSVTEQTILLRTAESSQPTERLTLHWLLAELNRFVSALIQKAWQEGSVDVEGVLFPAMHVLCRCVCFWLKANRLLLRSTTPKHKIFRHSYVRAASELVCGVVSKNISYQEGRRKWSKTVLSLWLRCFSHFKWVAPQSILISQRSHGTWTGSF